MFLVFVYVLGDIEVLMELSSYMQTAVCTQRSEILVLELKHFERLFVKRHPRTVDMMKDNLILRLQSRITPRLQQTVPLLGILLEQAYEMRRQRRLQSQVRTKGQLALNLSCIQKILHTVFVLYSF